MTTETKFTQEPSWEMLIAGRDALMDTDDEIDLSTDQIRDCYLAMLAASPNRFASIKQLEADLAAQVAGHQLSAKQSTDNLLRATAAEKQREALMIAGKHLAVKLVEAYRAAGIRPGDCQAVRDWMDAHAKAVRS